MASASARRKNCAAARQATKNGRRKKRLGKKAWMKGLPVMKDGMGGTDKSHRGGRKTKGVFYSDKPATR